MFETFVVQPVLNLLIFMYAIIPGHNFGLSIILFTIFIRFVMHPLIKKQLHHGRAMRALQPEIDKIKKATKGDSQETSRLTMELYKEREISPLASLWPLLIQIVVLIGLYTGLRHIAEDPSVILSKSYEWLKNMPTLKELAVDINRFDFTLFGFVDLSRSVNGPAGFYFPALVLVVASSIAQFFMGKQTLPDDKEARTLRQILKESRSGGDRIGTSEVQGLLGQSLKYLIPIFILVLTYGLPSAIALYWFASGVVGYYQQRMILNQDSAELLHFKKKIK